MGDVLPIRIFRRKYDSGGAFVGDEYVAENHAIMMYAPLIAEKGEEAGE